MTTRREMRLPRTGVPERIAVVNPFARSRFVGPVTLELQKTYLAAVNVLDERWTDWLDVVEMAPARA